MEQPRHLEDRVREIDLEDATRTTWNLLDESGALHSATTLIKQNGMRVVLLALEEGAEIPSHHVNADITAQVLRGRVRFRVGDEDRILETGRLLAVERNLRHDVLALEQSELLLTLSWRL